MNDKTAERFWDKVDKNGDDECWEWMASKNNQKYGHLWHNGRLEQAHRVAWELTNGSIPRGDHHGTTCVCHKCDNPDCCNPGHLFLATQAENIADMVKKGRTGNHAGENNGRSKLTNLDVVWIRLWLKLGHYQKDIAAAFGVDPKAVNRINLGQGWSHV